MTCTGAPFSLVPFEFPIGYIPPPPRLFFLPVTILSFLGCLPQVSPLLLSSPRLPTFPKTEHWVSKTDWSPSHDPGNRPACTLPANSELKAWPCFQVTRLRGKQLQEEGGSFAHPCQGGSRGTRLRAAGPAPRERERRSGTELVQLGFPDGAAEKRR